MGLIRSMRRHWGRWLVGAVVVVALVVVGGPFVFFHFIEGPAPPPLSLSSESSTTTSSGATVSTAAPAALDGVWDVTTGSQAGYRVQEILFGQSHTAVGRTSAVTGNLTIAATTVTAGRFSVDLTKVSSDQSLRDEQFQGRIMDTATYPTATFVLTEPISLGSVPAQGVEITEQATGTLTMHGVTRSVIFHLTARRSGDLIEVSGSIPVTFADWNIANPSGGPAETANSGIMEFLVNLVHA
jgi:polyisoprenoid-binding protein YceI